MRRPFAATLVGLASLCAAILGSQAGARESAPGEREFVFGVVPQQSPGADDMRRMGRGGIDSFRVWLGWAAVEREPGEFDWGAYDSLFAAAAGEGVTPLPYLYGTPAWAAGADGQSCAGSGCIPFAPRSDGTRAAFAGFAGEAARRYGPGGEFWAEHPELPYHPIRTWQIWNEQNLTDYWRPRPDVSSYAALLAPAAEAIREADPEAEIVLGGMWGPRHTPKGVVRTARYLRQLYRQPGARESFDALAVHPYSAKLEGVLDQVRRVRSVAGRSGDGDVALWVTEFGWASGGPRREGLVKDRREQGRLLRRTYTELRRRRHAWNIHGAYWYAWRDTPRRLAICAWCPRAGLHKVNGRSKPAWRKLTSLARR